MIAGHDPFGASAAMRASSSVFSTSARKLQNTCQRMVSSSLWKIGLVTNRCLAVRKALTETEVRQDDRRFLLRSTPNPAASLALRAAGVALPPTVRAVADC